MKFKVAIIGYGFVGKATEEGFKNKNDIFLVDPKLNTTIEQLKDFKPEYVFICLPTPMSNKDHQDCSIINKVVDELNSLEMKFSVLLKSTILPDNLLKVHERLNNHLIYNPEFLREKTATEDFINSDMYIFGGDQIEIENCVKLYKNSNCKIKNIVKTDLISASFIKYTINTFLALKVSYFNQMNELYSQMNGEDGDWEELIKNISHDPRIGSSHMNVPGHDGRKGFGGACFPKDTYALKELSKKLNNPLTILAEAIDYNNKVRSSYKNLDKREKEQNVTFN